MNPVASAFHLGLLTMAVLERSASDACAVSRIPPTFDGLKQKSEIVENKNDCRTVAEMVICVSLYSHELQ